MQVIERVKSVTFSTRGVFLSPAWYGLRNGLSSMSLLQALTSGPFPGAEVILQACLTLSEDIPAMSVLEARLPPVSSGQYKSPAHGVACTPKQAFRFPDRAGHSGLPKHILPSGPRGNPINNIGGYKTPCEKLRR